MIPKLPKLHMKVLSAGPKLPKAMGTTGMAGGLPGGAHAGPMIKSYADFKKLHFTPMSGTKLRIG
jgi:hypothetical protein